MDEGVREVGRAISVTLATLAEAVRSSVQHDLLATKVVEFVQVTGACQ
jgi:hypothetical protein